MRSTRPRHAIVAALILGTGCLLGGFLGTELQADSKKQDDDLRTFAEVLALIEDNYVGEVDPTEMVENAVQGMLRELDPHSSYLAKEAYSEMRDEQRGKFYGLGIQIAKRGPDKPLTIIAPIDETPASRAGLQAGDIIFKIEGEKTIDLTVQEAVRLLKGDRGTKVSVTIKRPGLSDLFDVTLERDEIPINSIRVAYMLDAITGIVRISNFTSTTSDELDAAIARLTDEGMERLILDLRGNPGGLLEQAVSVAERFIDIEKLLVYTRGRVPGSDQDFHAREGVQRLDLPLIVLVNSSSASASEIVSGAIQDHDRGLVIGETTFGKGLVQRVIPLRNGGAVAVTTAKYYTPSGRLIQRDYSDLDDYYFHDEDDATDAPETTDPEIATDDPTLKEIPSLDDREVFLTASGREVFGGGGITPDYSASSPKVSTLFSRIRRENLFFDFSVRYAAQHEDLKKGFKADDKLLAEFKAYLNARSFEFDPDELAEDIDNIGLMLRAQISRVKWGAVEESRVLAEADPLIQKALQSFAEAERLAQLGEYGEPGPRESAELLN
jgi:carboxyl-terminal processing protease